MPQPPTFLRPLRISRVRFAPVRGLGALARPESKWLPMEAASRDGRSGRSRPSRIRRRGTSFCAFRNGQTLPVSNRLSRTLPRKGDPLIPGFKLSGKRSAEAWVNRLLRGVLAICAFLVIRAAPAGAEGDERPEGWPATMGAEEDPVWEAEAQAWYAMPSGWIFITRGSQPGTATRARQDRDFRLDSEVIPSGGAWVRFWGPNVLGFRAVSTEESGTHTTERDFIYHGETYGEGRQVHAAMGFLLLDLDYQYRWKVSDDIILVPHVGGEYWGFSSRIRTVDSLPSIDEQRTFSSGYWLAGLDFEARLSDAFRSKVTLLGGATGTDRYFIRADAGLALDVAPHLALTASYRFHNVRFHTSTNEADLFVHGPTVGIEARY